MTGKGDDLEAVRVVAETLEPFSTEDRERIIRWARERVGMTAGIAPADIRTTDTMAPTVPAAATQVAQGAVDIKQFVTDKSPKSDVHFAATVAYYYQFVAPPTQRKEAITKDDLVEACRQVPRKRPARPSQVLVNAYQDGVLDRGDKGRYKLNSVGENLVAMALPGKAETTTARKAPNGRKRREAKAKNSRSRKARR